MKIPQTFLPENKNLERKTEDLLKGYKKETDDSTRLELLKERKTRKEKKEFLKLFIEQIPYIIGEVKGKMIQTETDYIYLTKEDENDARLEIWMDGHLRFLDYGHSADLDDKEFYSYNGYGAIYDCLDTFPGQKNDYKYEGRDLLDKYFKKGKEMYECIKDFLAK